MGDIPKKKAGEKTAKATTKNFQSTRAFKAEGTEFSDDTLGESILKIESYDPHELTQNIIEFGKALTGVPLYSYQEPFVYRIIYSVVSFENAEITGLWARQSGKSESIAFVIVTLMVILPALAEMTTTNEAGEEVAVFPELNEFREGIKIGLYAPQQLQVDTTYDRALARLKNKNASLILDDPGLNIGLVSDRKLALSNGSFCMGQVASKTSKIESKTWHLIILEEAQDSDDFVVMKSIEPMLTATAGTLVKVGTTGISKNNFWNSIQNNRTEQRKIKDEKLKLHFEFDYKMVIKAKMEQFQKDGKREHLNYQRDVLKKRDKWGEDSDAFKLGFALIWAMETGMFITDTQFDKITNRRLGIIEELRREHSNWLICMGIDYGKDRASTVITIGRSFYPNPDEYSTEPPYKQVIKWIEMKEENYEFQHSVIMSAIAEYGVQIVACDYTGVGKGPTDRLMVACGEEVQVIPYTFSRPTKSDMWSALDADIKCNRLIVPANKETRATEEYLSFEQQMKGLHKSYEGGYMVCSKGDGIGERDDYCDSLGLFIIAANSDIPEEMEETDENPFYSGDDIDNMDLTSLHY